jgi:hypothetical protein
MSDKEPYAALAAVAAQTDPGTQTGDQYGIEDGPPVSASDWSRPQGRFMHYMSGDDL